MFHVHHFCFGKVWRTVTKSVFFMGPLLPKPETQILRFCGVYPFWSIYLRGIFYRTLSKILWRVPTTNPVMSFFRGSFWVKKARSAVMISKRTNENSSRWPEGVISRKKIQALIFWGLVECRGRYNIQTCFFCMFLPFFLNGFLGEMTWLF